LQSRGGCRLETLTIQTVYGAYSTQEEACARQKTSGGTTTFEYKDNTITSSSGRRLSGRYPIYSGTAERGGQNVILSQVE
jgi:hypothetical protein